MSRAARFRRAPGARAGLAVLIALVLVAAFAGLLASDLPLACRAEGKFYFLPCVTRPLALAGADNQLLRASGAWLIAPPIPYGPESQHPGGVTAVLQPPSRAHLFGTDDRGRDVAARLVHGTRVALAVGLVAVLLYVALGLAVGVTAAMGRRADLVLGRVIEVGLTFPTLFLLLAIQGLTATASVVEVGLAIALTQWPHVARLVRAEALRAMASPHVEAARAIGASPARLGIVHVLPLAASPALVAGAFGVGQAVLFETALSFLGFGVPAPTASWGELLGQAQAAGLPLWLLLPPTGAIALTVVACSLVGDGLRRALEET
ncbi:MAG TPA: ABC transporter permease [Polyangia bacterium]|nr:ABC transporter permease [Polyangia bacterium]